MRSISHLIFFILINEFYNFSLGINIANNNITEDSGSTTNNNDNSNNEEVSETQYATCRIVTDELVANAQANVTRVLTGVCNADTVDARFQQLESMIKKEFNEIKQTLHSMTKLYEMKNDNFDIVDPRQSEIDRLNNSIHTVNTPTGIEKTFFYFVRVKDFDQKTSHWDLRWFERSSTFYLPVRQYAMYVKVTPRDVNGEITYVNIGAGLTRGIYDDTLEWPFTLKHQIEILDHSSQGFQRDIKSSIVNPLISSHPLNYWDKPASSFGNGDNRQQIGITIPVSFILNTNNNNNNNNNNYHSQSTNSYPNIAKYIWNGDLIIKLIIYL